MKKTINNTYNLSNLNEKIELYGWVAKRRNLGGLIFIDLRDRSGIIQLVIKPENKYFDLAETFKTEAVIRAVGVIRERESKNAKLATGDVEVEVSELELINNSVDLPFELSKDTSAHEDTRMKYRYLDIRRENIKDNLMLRHKVVLAARNYLSSLGFLEVETPILCKSTPEGARDYLVPSRIFNGKFFALPQSPQIYKQLLMIGGMEKYFQIARCFRDEDLRADRQPEFSQIDLEMSFVEERDVWEVVEGLIKEMFRVGRGLDLNDFPQMKYKEAMAKYGSDKPDTRFELFLEDISDVFAETEFETYKEILTYGKINAIVVNAADKYSRKDLDKLSDFVKIYGAKYLSYLKYSASELSGSIAKNMSDKEKENLTRRLSLKENDLLLIVADKERVVKESLGALRLKVAKEQDLIDQTQFNCLWITDFPMFEYIEEEERFVAAHHPFTSPKLEDMDKLLTDKANCYSRAYDLVINGYEVLSGSIRIHDEKLQKKVFEAIGMSEEEARDKFGFFLDAFKYGTPPHGGVGIGLERVIMLLSGTDNIRDVVAFPKTASASDLMSDAPNLVSRLQLDELGISLK